MIKNVNMQVENWNKGVKERWYEKKACQAQV